MQSVARKLAGSHSPSADRRCADRAMGPQPQKHAEDQSASDLEISADEEQEKGKERKGRRLLAADAAVVAQG